MAEYSEMFMRLTYEVGIITFIKRDGTPRVMMCTRNLKTAALYHGNMGGLLNGHDKRCNIRNGNLAVVDLLIGECRSFNAERVVDEKYFGEVLDKDKLDEIAVKANKIDKVIKDGMTKIDSMDTL